MIALILSISSSLTALRKFSWAFSSARRSWVALSSFISLQYTILTLLGWAQASSFNSFNLSSIALTAVSLFCSDILNSYTFSSQVSTTSLCSLQVSHSNWSFIKTQQESRSLLFSNLKTDCSRSLFCDVTSPMRIWSEPGDLFCNSVLIALREVMRDDSSRMVWERCEFQACRCWYLTRFDYQRGSRQRKVSLGIKWQWRIVRAIGKYSKRISLFKYEQQLIIRNRRSASLFYTPFSLKVYYNFILLNLMTQKLPPLSHEDLLSLVRGRKFKEYPRYIREIQNMIQGAQESVSSVLKCILVEKKEKDPTVMLNALVLYKSLMVSACFDYSFSDEYFPQSVHAEVVKICQYKPNIETFSSRGGDYFIETLKIPKTQQNKDMLERTGNSYVLMALELVQAMAAWYPNDYSSPNTPSFFKTSYEELLKKRVTFPNREQQLIIKKTDEENFKTNYGRFKKRMQELDEAEPNSPQKKPPPGQGKKEEVVESKVVMKSAVVVAKEKPPPNNGNALNIAPMQSNADMLILRGQMTSSKPAPKNVPKDPPKKQTNPKDPSMVPLPNIFATNQLPESSKTNPTLFKQAQKSEIKRDIKEEREVFRDSDEQFEDMPMPKESSARFGKIDDSKVKIETKPNNNPPAKPNPISSVKPQEEPKQKPAQVAKPPPPQPARQSVPNKSQPPPQQSSPAQSVPKKQVQASSFKPEQPAKKPEKLQDIPKPPKEEIAVSVVRDFAGPKPSPRQPPKRQPNNSLNIQPREEEQIGGVFSFTQKDFGQTIKRDSLTPRKIAKMEKGSSGMPSLQMSPNNDPQPNQAPRPRSLPKTERTLKTAQHFFPNKILPLYKGMDIIEPSQSPTTKGYFNKTLSDFAKNRPKNLPSKQLQKAISLQGVLNELKLDVRRVPFIPRYYEPITRTMRALRGESLTLFNSGTSSNQFFANALIECRLVKQGNNIFSLMLQNVSSLGIIIEYCQMKSLKYSNRIKILSWANRHQIGPYEVPRKGFMDIRFRFSVGDLNFKFLSFFLRVNGKVEALVLPLTLLDMCEVSPRLPDLYRFSLNGSIIASEGFVLGERGLPPFLGGFRFTPLSNSRGKHERGQVIGQGSLRWEGEDGPAEVGVLVRVAEWQQRRIEVSIIHEVRRQESEDLAKIVLYLLVFLLEHD